MRKIPKGKVYCEVRADAAKAYPTRIFDRVQDIRFAYADISKDEKIFVGIKLAPEGCITARHPQVVFFVRGDYHMETPGYAKSDLMAWTTWMEFHIPASKIDELIDALQKIKVDLTSE